MTTACASLATPTREFIAPRVNWRQIADDIKSMGLSYRQQAFRLDVEVSTMQRWLEGGDPVHSVGHAWLELHAEICGATLTQLRQAEAGIR